MIQEKLFVSPVAMGPKPIKMGLSPPLYHSMNSGNSSSVVWKGFFLLAAKVPPTRHCSGQSTGLGTKAGDHMALKGILLSLTACESHCLEILLVGPKFELSSDSRISQMLLCSKPQKPHKIPCCLSRLMRTSSLAWDEESLLFYRTKAEET